MGAAQPRNRCTPIGPPSSCCCSLPRPWRRCSPQRSSSSCAGRKNRSAEGGKQQVPLHRSGKLSLAEALQASAELLITHPKGATATTMGAALSLQYPRRRAQRGGTCAGVVGLGVGRRGLHRDGHCGPFLATQSGADHGCNPEAFLKSWAPRFAPAFGPPQRPDSLPGLADRGKPAARQH